MIKLKTERGKSSFLSINQYFFVYNSLRARLKQLYVKNCNPITQLQYIERITDSFTTCMEGMIGTLSKTKMDYCHRCYRNNVTFA